MHFALDPEMTDADWEAARRLARNPQTVAKLVEAEADIDSAVELELD